ncbi:ragulator complex protein LAMTOR3 homolog isoform X2 [Gordionus sp. m RMFG-2023]|uniref:ragulator complex protein LAMTOR3 homolog isoform X2 n=1 Tax=Gordionus sp. m RMFG-2023 TaxID=3053472 RepID=UPI0031FDE5D7
MELENILKSFVTNHKNLHAIIYHDKEGIIILKENIITIDFLNIFNLSTHQINKIGMGDIKKLLITLKNYQIIQFNKDKVILTAIISKNSNMGFFLNLDEELNELSSLLQSFV